MKAVIGAYKRTPFHFVRRVRLAAVRPHNLAACELHEAFMLQPLACARKLCPDELWTSIASGESVAWHPLGGLGSRITGKAIAPLQKPNGRNALPTQRINIGEGIVTIQKRA